VAFSTLEGRPSAYNFDESKELQVFIHGMWKMWLLAWNKSIFFLLIGFRNCHWHQDHFGPFKHLWWWSLWWSQSAQVLLLRHFRLCCWWQVRYHLLYSWNGGNFSSLSSAF
jgi:hypothetical protein